MPKQGGPSPEARYTYMTKKASTRRRVEISCAKVRYIFCLRKQLCEKKI